jgi:hypothetical protein
MCSKPHNFDAVVGGTVAWQMESYSHVPTSSCRGARSMAMEIDAQEQSVHPKKRLISVQF